jgi:hypothetical protein
MYFRTPTKLAASASLILATCAIAACSSGTTSTSSSEGAGAGTASESASPSPAAVRESFTSPEYGYTVTLPAGWTAIEAHERWDGSTELNYQYFGADQFTGTSFAASFGVAAKWKHGLASYARYLVALNARTHGEDCPSKPQTERSIAIGGSPGVLLEYNCGILINQAATVHHGVGYLFVLRDPSVQAAFDQSDHAVFVRMLRSVEYPR